MDSSYSSSYSFSSSDSSSEHFSSTSGSTHSLSGDEDPHGGGDPHYIHLVEATKWSVITSSGFLVPSLLLSVFFIYLEAKKKKKRPREAGDFAIFMILLELIDAIPEAAVIAQATINHSVTWSFILSILSLNIINTSASAIDFLATKNSKTLHQYLFALLFFSVGMLCYSISVDVYGKFAEEFSLDERGGVEAFFLMFGTFVGFSLIILLMKLEHKLHGEESGSEDALARVLQVIQNQLAIITPKLDHYNNWQTYLQNPAHSHSALAALPLHHQPPTPIVFRQTHDDDNIAPGQEAPASTDTEIEISEETIGHLLRRANHLRQMETLVSFMYAWDHGREDAKEKLAIVEDFSLFIAEQTGDKLDKEEFIRLKNSSLKHKRKQGLSIVLGEDAWHLIDSPEKTEETPLVTSWKSSIYWRAFKFSMFMSVVFLWSIGLTTLLAKCLAVLEERTTTLSSYMEPFCEGLSGGAFLSTVSGTMIFRIQKDFYGSEWSVNVSKTIGMSCFVFGIVFSNFISMFE